MGVTIDTLGRRWVSALHPRDSKGRFIETGGIARIWGRGLATIVMPKPGNRVEVEYDGGKREIVSAYRVTMVRRPNGEKPTRSKTKVLDEDARRDADPDRPTADYDKGTLDGEDRGPADRKRIDPENDPGDEDDNGEDDNYQRSRSNVEHGDYVLAAGIDEAGNRTIRIGRAERDPEVGHMDFVDGNGRQRLAGIRGTEVIPREDIKPDVLEAFLNDQDGPGPLARTRGVDPEAAKRMVLASLDDSDGDGTPDAKDPDAPAAEKRASGEKAPEGGSKGHAQRRGETAKASDLREGRRPGERLYAPYQTDREEWVEAGRIVRDPDRKNQFYALTPEGRRLKGGNLGQAQEALVANLNGADVPEHKPPKGKTSKLKPLPAAPEATGDRTPLTSESFTTLKDPDAGEYRHEADTEHGKYVIKPNGRNFELTDPDGTNRGAKTKSEAIQKANDDLEARRTGALPSREAGESDADRAQVSDADLLRRIDNGDGTAADEWQRRREDAAQRLAEASDEELEAITGPRNNRNPRTPASDAAEKIQSDRAQQRINARRSGGQDDAPLEDTLTETPAERDKRERREAVAAGGTLTRHFNGEQRGQAITEEELTQEREQRAAEARVHEERAAARKAERQAYADKIDRAEAAGDTRDQVVAAEEARSGDKIVITQGEGKGQTRRVLSVGPGPNGDDLILSLDEPLPGQHGKSSLVPKDSKLKLRRVKDSAASKYDDAQVYTGDQEVTDDTAGDRRPGEQVLGDVPADAVPGDPGDRPADVLPDSGQRGRGGDRDADGAESQGEGDPRDAAGASTPASGDGRGAGAGGGSGRDGVPPAGAGDPGPGDADDADDPARGNARGPVAPVDFDPRGLGNLVPSNKNERAEANLKALRLLRKLQREKRYATPEEQRVLAGFSGWGALPQVFVKGRGFDEYNAELRTLLSEADYKEALDNTRNAHYTDPALVDVMWEAIREAGFDGGDVLEAGSGSGNFIGYSPAGTRMHGIEKNEVTASIAKLLYPNHNVRNESFADTQVKPGQFDAMIGNVPFSRVGDYDPVYNRKREHSLHNQFIIKGIDALKPGGYSAVITSTGTMDNLDSRSREKIYEQADLVTAIRLPGNTHLDAAGTTVVTDLLVFRKRKPGEAPGDPSWLNASDTKLDDGTTMRVNDYFHTRKDNVLGETFTAQGREGASPSVGVKGDAKQVPGQTRQALGAALDAARREGRGYNPEAVATPEPEAKPKRGRKGVGGTVKKPTPAASPTGENLYHAPSERTARRGKKIGQITHVGTTAVPGKRAGAQGSVQHHYTIVDFDGKEKAYSPDGSASATGKLPKPGAKNPNQADELAVLLRMRDLDADLREAETESLEDTPEIKKLRKELNDLYDTYVGTYGPIGRVKLGRRKVAAPADPEDESQTEGLTEENGEWYTTSRLSPPMGGIRKDPTWWALTGLEKSYDENTGTAERADRLKGRTAGKRRLPETAETPAEAVAISRDYDGTIDLDRIAALLDVAPDKVRDVLGDQVFTDHRTGELVPRHVYLAGDTRTKAKELKALAETEPEKWQASYLAMQAAVPPDKSPDKITAVLGAPWIPGKDVEDFLHHLVDNTNARVEVTTDPVNGSKTFKVVTPKSGRRYPNREGGSNMDAPPDWDGRTPLEALWGTDRRNTYDLLETLLKGARPEVKDKVEVEPGTFKEVRNVKATEAAQRAADKIQREFGKWLWRDPERRDRLAADYNERYRSHTDVNYVDSYYSEYPGMSDAIDLDGHQNDAVAMAKDMPSVLLAHEVGTGKTFTMAAAVMELKRLQMVDKPVMVVPNHLLEQVVREFKELYPNANLLATDSKGLDGDGRRRFVAQAAYNDWDAVIMTKSSFYLLPLDEETDLAAEDEKIAKLEEQLGEAVENGDTAKVKKLMTQIADRKGKLKQLEARLRSDVGALDFKTAGFDYVVVDEAHEYKNDEVISGMRQLRKDKPNLQAVDLRMKLDFLREENPRRGKNKVALFATGTPVSNSTREFYVMMRFLRPDLFERFGITEFDDFAKLWLTREETVETDVSGNIKIQAREGDMLLNAGEMKRAWVQFADEVTADDVGLERPKLKNGKATQVVVQASDNLKQFVKHLGVRKQLVKPSFRPKPGEDTHIAIGTDGLLAAVDLRLMPDEKLIAAGIDPRSLTDADSKIPAVGDAVLEEWARTKDMRFKVKFGAEEDHPNPGAAQIVFLDKGIPTEGVGGKHSTYEALKAYLVKGGMKPEEVAFIHDAAGDPVKMGQLSDKVRSGEVKVLIGSTARMGTGLNVQNRLSKLHHMDGSYRPDQIEQRNGRILRRLNQNSEVEIAYYPVAGSTEGFQWGHVGRKDNFLRQFSKADLDATIVGRPDDGATESEFLKAAAQDDPLLMDEAMVEKTFRTMEGESDAYHASIEYHTNQVNQGTQRVLALEQAIEALDRAAALVVPTEGDAFTFTTGDRYRDGRRIPAATFEDRKDAVADLAALAEDLTGPGAYLPAYGPGRPTEVGNLGGLKVWAHAYSYGHGSKPKIRFTVADPASSQWNPTMLRLGTVEIDPKKVDLGALKRIENLVASVPGSPAILRNEIDHTKSEIATSAVEMDKDWENAEEFKALVERRDALKDLMKFRATFPADPTPIDIQNRIAYENAYKQATERHTAIRDARLNNGQTERTVDLGAVRTSRRKVKAQNKAAERTTRGEDPTPPVQRKKNATEDGVATGTARPAGARKPKPPVERTPGDPNAPKRPRTPVSKEKREKDAAELAQAELFDLDLEDAPEVSEEVLEAEAYLDAPETGIADDLTPVAPEGVDATPEVPGDKHDDAPELPEGTEEPAEPVADETGWAERAESLAEALFEADATDEDIIEGVVAALADDEVSEEEVRGYVAGVLASLRRGETVPGLEPVAVGATAADRPTPTAGGGAGAGGNGPRPTLSAGAEEPEEFPTDPSGALAPADDEAALAADVPETDEAADLTVLGQQIIDTPEGPEKDRLRAEMQERIKQARKADSAAGADERAREREEREERGPKPTAPDGAMAIMGEIAANYERGDTEGGGVSQLGFNKPALENAIAKGWIERLDTGDPDTDGGRYRLQLTDAGVEQLARGQRHNYYGRNEEIDAYLAARTPDDAPAEPATPGPVTPEGIRAIAAAIEADDDNPPPGWSLNDEGAIVAPIETFGVARYPGAGTDEWDQEVRDTLEARRNHDAVAEDFSDLYPRPVDIDPNAIDYTQQAEVRADALAHYVDNPDELWDRDGFFGNTSPMAIRREDGSLVLIDGNHRWLAAKMRGDETMPLIVLDSANRQDATPDAQSATAETADASGFSDLSEEAVRDILESGGASDAARLLPGVTGKNVEDFTSGRCAELALAIHDQTGWPLVVVGYQDEDSTAPGWSHAMVETPDGRLLDVTGLHDPADVLNGPFGDYAAHFADEETDGAEVELIQVPADALRDQLHPDDRAPDGGNKEDAVRLAETVLAATREETGYEPAGEDAPTPAPERHPDVQQREEAEAAAANAAEEASAAPEGEFDGQEPPSTVVPEGPSMPVATDARVDEPTPEIPADYEPRTPAQLEDEDYPLNPYQQVIADDAVIDKVDVVAAAKAGTGKTSTAVAIAKRKLLLSPKENGGYLAFNKSVRLEAVDRMPKNVESLTGHGAPFRWKGEEYTDARFRKGLIVTDDVAAHLGIPDADMAEVGDQARQAWLVMHAVSRYSLSNEDKIGPEHFATPDGNSLIEGVSEDDKNRLLGWANAAWDDIQRQDGKLYVDNDHIRKMWALARPDFSQPGWGFKKPLDFVFLDEAQDTPPVLAGVMARQTIQRIILGDSDQAIYGSFTGSVDYMKSIVPSEGRELRRRPLPESYRYGSVIADAGNRPLQIAGSPERVIGSGSTPGEVVEPNTMSDADAILVRSNGGMLAEALAEIEANGDERVIGVPKGTVGNLRSMIETVRFLRDGGKRPRQLHEDFARYATWKQWEEAADNGDDQRAAMLKRILEQRSLGELQGIVDQMTEVRNKGEGIGEHPNLQEIRLVSVPDEAGRTWITGDYKLNQAISSRPEYRGLKDYLWQHGIRSAKFGEVAGAGTYSKGKRKGQQMVGVTFDSAETDAVAQAMRDFYNEPEPKTPDVVISTVHKAKGLEWDNVRAGRDFKQPKVQQNELTGETEIIYPNDEEMRIAYVAFTRAAKKLDPGSLAWLFDHTDPNGGDPNAGKATQQADVPEQPSAAADVPEVPEAGEEVIDAATGNEINLPDPAAETARADAHDAHAGTDEAAAALAVAQARVDYLTNVASVDDVTWSYEKDKKGNLRLVGEWDGFRAEQFSGSVGVNKLFKYRVKDPNGDRVSDEHWEKTGTYPHTATTKAEAEAELKEQMFATLGGLREGQLRKARAALGKATWEARRTVGPDSERPEWMVADGEGSTTADTIPAHMVRPGTRVDMIVNDGKTTSDGGDFNPNISNGGWLHTWHVQGEFLGLDDGKPVVRGDDGRIYRQERDFSRGHSFYDGAVKPLFGDDLDRDTSIGDNLDAVAWRANRRAHAEFWKKYSATNLDTASEEDLAELMRLADGFGLPPDHRNRVRLSEAIDARKAPSVDAAGAPASVVVIACGWKKLDHAAPAGEMYQGSLHRNARAAADAMVARGEADKVMILSAKHGLLDLDQVIDPYDMTMGDPEAITAEGIANQMQARGLAGTRIVSLTPKDYTKRMVDASALSGVTLDAPMEGSRGIGDINGRLARIKRGETDPATAGAPTPDPTLVEEIRDWTDEDLLARIREVTANRAYGREGATRDDADKRDLYLLELQRRVGLHREEMRGLDDATLNERAEWDKDAREVDPAALAARDEINRRANGVDLADNVPHATKAERDRERAQRNKRRVSNRIPASQEDIANARPIDLDPDLGRPEGGGSRVVNGIELDMLDRRELDELREQIGFELDAVPQGPEHRDRVNRLSDQLDILDAEDDERDAAEETRESNAVPAEPVDRDRDRRDEDDEDRDRDRDLDAGAAAPDETPEGDPDLDAAGDPDGDLDSDDDDADGPDDVDLDEAEEDEDDPDADEDERERRRRRNRRRRRRRRNRNRPEDEDDSDAGDLPGGLPGLPGLPVAAVPAEGSGSDNGDGDPGTDSPNAPETSTPNTTVGRPTVPGLFEQVADGSSLRYRDLDQLTDEELADLRDRLDAADTPETRNEHGIGGFSTEKSRVGGELRDRTDPDRQTRLADLSPTEAHNRRARRRAHDLAVDDILPNPGLAAADAAAITGPDRNAAAGVFEDDNPFARLDGNAQVLLDRLAATDPQAAAVAREAFEAIRDGIQAHYDTQAPIWNQIMDTAVAEGPEAAEQAWYGPKNAKGNRSGMRGGLFNADFAADIADIIDPALEAAEAAARDAGVDPTRVREALEDIVGFAGTEVAVPGSKKSRRLYEHADDPMWSLRTAAFNKYAATQPDLADHREREAMLRDLLANGDNRAENPLTDPAVADAVRGRAGDLADQIAAAGYHPTVVRTGEDGLKVSTSDTDGNAISLNVTPGAGPGKTRVAATRTTDGGKTKKISQATAIADLATFGDPTPDPALTQAADTEGTNAGSVSGDPDPIESMARDIPEGAALATDGPEPLINGVLPLEAASDTVLGTGPNDELEAEQVAYLATHLGEPLIMQLDGDWVRGHFTGPVTGSGTDWEAFFQPVGAGVAKDLRPITSSQVGRVTRALAAEYPGPEADPRDLRAGTMVWAYVPLATVRGWRRGVLEGISPEGRALFRDSDGVLHATKRGAGVRPVYGSYEPGSEPTEPAFAPLHGVWTPQPDGTLVAGMPGDYLARVTPDSWAVRGMGDKEGIEEAGEATDLDNAKFQVRDIIESWVLETGRAYIRPGDDEAERDRLAAEIDGWIGDYAAGIAATEGTEAEPSARPVEEPGEGAAWVDNATLEPGDVARVTGDTNGGQDTSKTGHVVGAPEPVTVHTPGKPATPGTRTTVADTPDGAGDRDTVLAPADAVSARSERDKDIPGTGTPKSAAEAEILSGRIPEQVPVDRYGHGIFPGSVVTTRDGAQGVVVESSAAGVLVRWNGEGVDRPVQPGLLKVADEGHRPDGWTHGGTRIAPGQIVAGGELETPGIVESVAGDTAVIATAHGPQRVEVADLVVTGTAETAPLAPVALAGTRLGEVMEGDLVMVPGGDGTTRVMEVLARSRNGRTVDLELVEPATGVIDRYSGDAEDDLVSLTDPAGRNPELPTETRPTFDTPNTAEGMDVRPIEPTPIDPVDGPTDRPVLTPREVNALTDLGLDTDSVTTGDIAQAAARIRAGMALSPTQATNLAAHLRRLAATSGMGKKKARIYKRIAERLTDSAARANNTPNPAPDEVSGEATPTTAGDLVHGDHTAIDTPDGLVVGEVIDNTPTAGGTATSLTIDADGERTTTVLPTGTPAHRLPDLPETPDDDLAPVEPSEIDRQVGPRVENRIREGIAAALTTALEGSDEAATITDLAEHVTHQLELGADDNEQTAAGGRFTRSLERSGLDLDTIEAADAAGRAAAAEAVEQAKQAMRDTLADAEPLPGETQAQAVERLRATLPMILAELDVDAIVRNAIEASRGASTRGEAADALHHSARDGIRADLLAFADELAAIGEVEAANLLSQVAARIAGNPDSLAVQAVVDALAAVNPTADRSALTVQVRSNMAARRRRFLDRVRALMSGVAAGGRRIGRTFTAALKAARNEWNDRAEAEAADLLAAATGTSARRAGEPTGFANRVAYWTAQLPGSIDGFGRRPGRGLTWTGLRREDLAGTVVARPADGTRLDRARDGGPGATALAHLEAVRGLGTAVDDEVAARIRAALPHLGDEPAAVVAEARRHADELERLARTPGAAPEVIKDAKKARKVADEQTAAYGEALAAATVAVLAGRRPLGGKLDLVGRSKKAPEVAAVAWAAQHFPADWLARLGALEVYTGPQGGYAPGRIVVAPGVAGDYRASALHGLAHALEAAIPGLADAQWAFHFTRTSGPDRSRRGPNAAGWLADFFTGIGLRHHDVTRLGDLPDAFLGVEHDGHSHWEILPLSLEMLFAGQFYADDDLRQFLMGLLAWMEAQR